MSDFYSYSNISAAYKCLQYYKLRVLDKVEVEGPESGDMHFGTAMHGAMEAMFTGGDALMAFTLYWDACRAKDMAYGRYKWEELAQRGETFISRFERLHKKKFEAKILEKRMGAYIGPIKLEGTPDMVGTFEGNLSVIDFKTSGYAYHKDKILINEQMYLYAFLAKGLGYDIKQLVYVVFVKAPEARIQIIKYDLTEDKLKDMMSNIEMMCGDLRARTQFPKNRNSCIMGERKCEYFDICNTKKS